MKEFLKEFLKLILGIILLTSIFINVLFIYFKPDAILFDFKNFFKSYNEYKIINNSDKKINEIIIGYKAEDNKEEAIINVYNIESKTKNLGSIDISKLNAKDIYIKYKIDNYNEKILAQNLNDTKKKLKDDFKLSVTINSIDKDGNISYTIN